MQRKPLSLFIAVALSTGLIITPAAANDALKKAQDFLVEKDFNSAVIELKNAIQQEPKNLQARLLLADTYFKINRWAAAEKEYVKAKELDGDKLVWMRPLAHSLSAQGKMDEISNYITHNEADSVEIQSESLAILGLVDFSRNNMVAASKLFTQSLERNPNNTQALIGLTNIHLQKNDREKGVQFIDRVLTIDPEHQEALILKGQVLAMDNQIEESLGWLQKSIDLNPRQIPARVMRANVNFAKQDVDAVKVDVDYLKQLAPDHFITDMLEGKLLLVQKQVKQAEEKLLSAQSKVNAKHPELEKLLGLIDINNQNWQKAELHLSSASQLNPGDDAVSVLLANLYLTQLKQPEKAISLFEKLLERNPDSQEFIARLADAYSRNGQLDKATELLEEKIGHTADPKSLKTLLAQTKFNAGEVGEAIKMLEQSSAVGEASLENAWLVMSYIRAKDFSKAEQVIRDVLKKEPSNALFNNMLGVTFFIQQNNTNALTYFNKAVATNKEYLAAHFNIARVYRAQNQNDLVISKLLELEKNFPENAKIAYALFQGYAALDKLEDANGWLETAVRRDGAFTPAVSQLIALRVQQKDTVDAVALANQFIAIDPKNPEGHYMLGRLYLTERDNSRISQAIESMQQAMNLSPNSSKYALALARTYLQEKSISQAVDALDRFLRNNPTDEVVASNKIAILVNNKQYAEATKAISTLAQQSQNPRLIAELNGDLLVAQNKTAEAIVQYEKALSLNASAKVVRVLHQLYDRTNDSQKATSVLVNWLKRFPQDVVSRFALASWYQNKANNENAIEQYEEILKHDPKNLFSLNNLAWMLMENGDVEAVNLANQVAAQNPDRADVLDTIGWIYVQFDQAEKGLVYLEKALSIDGSLREARYHAAVAYYKTGNNQKAKSMIEDLVKTGKPFLGFDDAKQLLKKL